MNVLVDTSIWSLALRRLRSDLNPAERVLVHDWERLVTERRATIIGPIRQEVLSGIREAEKFEALLKVLAPFPDEAIVDIDYVDAARITNRCRSAGLAVSAIDSLICAVAVRVGSPIYSTDHDFQRIKRFVAISLHATESPHRQLQ